MNTDFPTDPREALEASITALLLGELPPDQAAFLRDALARDPELARRYERLKQTIDLVQVTAKTPADEILPPTPALKLSQQRREQLLQHFKTVAPKEFKKRRRPINAWLVPMSVAALLVAVCGTLLLPALFRSKSRDVAPLGQVLFDLSRERELARVPNRQEAEKQVANSRFLSGRAWPVTASPDGKPLGIVPAQQVETAGVSTQIVLPIGGDLAQAQQTSLAMEPKAPPLNYDYFSFYRNPTPRLTSASAEFPTSTASAGGGGLGGGIPVTGGEATQRSYVLDSGKLADARSETEALGRSEITMLVDPATGLPIQAGKPVDMFTTFPSIGGRAITWTGSATLRGFYNANDATLPGSALERAAKEPSQEVLISTNAIALTGLSEIENKHQLSNSLPEVSARVDEAFAPALMAESRDHPQRLMTDTATSTSHQTKIEAGPVPSRQPPVPQTGSLDQHLWDLKSRADKGNLYAAKKHELEEDLKLRQALSAKIITEGADVELPKSSSVTLFDKALPGTLEKPGLLDRIRGKSKGEFKSVARVNVDHDRSKDAPAAYDPYFPQTEFEVIQSERVLKQVIKGLDLNKVWAEEKGASQELNSGETLQRLRKNLQLRPVPNTHLIEIGVTSDKPEQAANIANAIAQAYQNYRQEEAGRLTPGGIEALKGQLREQDQKIALAQRELKELEKSTSTSDLDDKTTKTPVPPSIPQPEIQTSDNAFSTFSLNVSDVSFKLAAASLEKGTIPDAAGIRIEEFINAFDYRDPEPGPGVPIGFTWERAQYPFAQNRDLLRFSLKTAAQGRQTGQPLNLVLLLDNSGSMERADRVRIIQEALRVLAAQLQPQDTFSVVTFARTARLWVDGIPGNQAGKVAEELSGLTPQGGTNLEEAMNLAYQTALQHYLPNGVNRVVLLTDGAANLGDVDPESLKQKVETNRKQGIALDCFGISWEGYNDDLLEVLTRNGDGRYGFINTPEEAADGFANQLAGALHVAAADVKVQVEFNPNRVTAFRQIGYAKHQLTKEQFRDNAVAAAELGAAESGNALYVVQVNPNGEGPIATVRVRYKVPGTTEFHEHEWPVPYTGSALALPKSSPALRLAATASAFGEWLSTSPYATEVTLDALLGYLNGIPEIYGADTRPKRLEWMIRQAKSITGK